MKKLFILILILITLFTPIKKQFTIINGNTGKFVYLDDIEKYKNFYITFIHSVNRTPVNEYYKIVDDRIILYKTSFYSYGAGMSDGSDIPNSIMTFNENGLVQLDLYKEFNEITYYVGTFANHTLHFGDKELMLKDLLEPKSPAIFSIKKVSIYTIITKIILP